MAALVFYMHDGPKAFRFEISGALAGGDVTKLQQAWRTASSTIQGKILAVDLTFVTSIDEKGEALLSQWRDQGAQFVANSVLSRTLVESVTGRAYTPTFIAPTFEPHFKTASICAALAAAVLSTMLLFPVKASAQGSAFGQKGLRCAINIAHF